MAASENPFSSLVTELPKPEGGSYGKYYSLTKLNDPRLGKCEKLYVILKEYWNWKNCAFRMEVFFSFPPIILFR
jgi:hypothetical protein